MLKRLKQKRAEKKFQQQLLEQLENTNELIEEMLQHLFKDHRLIIDYTDGSSITIFIDHIKMIERNDDDSSRLFLSVNDYIDTPYLYDVLTEAIALYKQGIRHLPEYEYDYE